MEHIMSLKDAMKTDSMACRYIREIIDSDFCGFDWSDMTFCRIREYIEQTLNGGYWSFKCRKVKYWELESDISFDVDGVDYPVRVNGDFVVVEFEDGEIEYFADEMAKNVIEMVEHESTDEYRLGVLDEVGMCWDNLQKRIVNIC